MANFIQFRRSRRSSTSSVYMQLLSSLATDLDNMLSELCTTPPPPYDRLSDSELHTRFGNGWKFGGDKSGEQGGWAAN
ncbi:unnamed protein product [Tenebrio molitor]|nr:unnamed protein product [Tenebrio molitor]